MWFHRPMVPPLDPPLSHRRKSDANLLKFKLLAGTARKSRTRGHKKKPGPPHQEAARRRQHLVHDTGDMHQVPRQNRNRQPGNRRGSCRKTKPLPLTATPQTGAQKVYQVPRQKRNRRPANRRGCRPSATPPATAQTRPPQSAHAQTVTQNVHRRSGCRVKKTAGPQVPPTKGSQVPCQFRNRQPGNRRGSPRVKGSHLRQTHTALLATPQTRTQTVKGTRLRSQSLSFAPSHIFIYIYIYVLFRKIEYYIYVLRSSICTTFQRCE